MNKDLDEVILFFQELCDECVARYDVRNPKARKTIQIFQKGIKALKIMNKSQLLEMNATISTDIYKEIGVDEKLVEGMVKSQMIDQIAKKLVDQLPIRKYDELEFNQTRFRAQMLVWFTNDKGVEE